MMSMSLTIEWMRNEKNERGHKGPFFFLELLLLLLSVGEVLRANKHSRHDYVFHLAENANKASLSME